MQEIDPEMNPLGLEPVQGCAVTAVGVSISNAAGSFKDPLALDPAVIRLFANAEVGDTIYGIVRMDVVSFAYKPVKDHEDQLRYIPALRCTDATPIDSELGAELINQQRDIIARRRIEAVRSPLSLVDGGEG